MRMAKSFGEFLTASALALVLLMPVGCGEGELREVLADGVALDMTTAALTLGEIDYLQGYYGAACTNRVERARWSIRVNDGAVALDPADRLSVVENDTTCVLTLDRVVLGSSNHVAADAIALSTAFTSTAATAFTLENAVETIFYANARLSSADFGSDFTVVFVYSDDLPSVIESDHVADYAVHEGTYSDVSYPVESPDHSLEMDEAFIARNGDDYVVSATGTINLALSSTAGQAYAVWDHENPTGSLASFHDVDLLWNDSALVKIGLDVIEDSGVYKIPVEEFDLVNLSIEDPGVTRSIIVRNLDDDSGVPAYQLFTITFKAFE